jgi:heat-inducible transcriptional repressor
MRQPEFAYTQSLIPVMQVLEDETVLLQILDSTAQADGTPRVKIGSENETEELAGVSVVASRFGRGEGEGIVAVIGPTRMDYSKVLKAVRMASRTLTDE